MTGDQTQALDRPQLTNSYVIAGPKRRLEGPRILLVSEQFPDDLVHSVQGNFQRLRVLLDAASAVAPVDLLFYWLTDNALASEEVDRRYADLAAAWNLEGSMWLCRAGRMGGSNRIGRNLADLPWVIRGAVGFKGARPTMRSSGKTQAEVLDLALREQKPNLILAHGQGALAPILRASVPLAPVVIDFPDVEHVRLRRAAARIASLGGRLRTWGWSILARHVEIQALRRSRASMVCSETDRRQLHALVPEADIHVLPNTVADMPFLPLLEAPVALFVGNFTYPPNAEAMAWLLEEIWPRVLEAIPEARLMIVGQDGEKLGAAIPALAGVEITGFLGSLVQAYAAARLVVCPIERGGGTRIKIIEAAAYGRPVVSTTIGAEGLAFADGREILIRDRAGDFAHACITLLRDRATSERLARAARELTRRLYGRAEGVALASRIMREAMAVRQT